MGICVVKYRMGKGFKHFCAMVDGLAFFPIGHIHERMNYLKDVVPPGVENLILYFDSVHDCGTSYEELEKMTNYKYFIP